MRKEKLVKGSIEVITGSMFSGKTEELIRRINSAKQENLNIHVYKPLTDNRYDTTNVVSHNNNKIEATPINASSKILSLTKENIQVVGIDEAQFFDSNLPSVCNILANKGIKLIIAGLDMDYLAQPFGSIPHLLAIADDITKLHASCAECKSEALYSHRILEKNNQVLIGGKDAYIPLCRDCYIKKQKQQNP